MSEASKLCRECGTMVSSDRSECPQCGAMLNKDTEVTKTKSSNRKWLKFGCLGVIGFFILMAIIGSFAKKDEGDGAASLANGAEETAQEADAATELNEPKNDPAISSDEFTQLQTGMSYDDAARIIGSPGELLSENEIAGTRTVMYMWDGDSGIGANANAMFQDDKLVQKSQFGLR